MIYTPEELKSAYEQDLESDIRTNAEQIAKGRTDLIEYDRKCRAELKALRATTRYRIVYGVPTITE